MAVYFIQAGETEFVKIGFADEPTLRLTELQTGHYETLSIIRQIEGGRKVEKWLHRYFGDHLVRGEWFRFVPEMLTLTPPDMKPPSPYVAGALASVEQRAGAAGLTMQEVCSRAGVSISTFNRWKAGTVSPTLRMFSAIETVLEQYTARAA